MRGFSLLELMLVMALTSVLLLGLVELMSAGSAMSYRQDQQARLQQNARLAVDTIRQVIRPAGYSPEPWNPTWVLTDPLAGSADAVSASSDRLMVTRWSDRNCFDYRNPDTGADGRARYYRRETRLDLTSSGHLALQCRYGPTPDDMTMQINRQGRVPGITGLQFDYGEDRDGDGYVDTWSKAGDWLDPDSVLGVKVGLQVEEGTLLESFEFLVALPGRSG